ncbi:hypothetical protein PtA15_5A278 [Puccinia triticina]|uniref:Uncharacterized protein n=1 Tax=Puccinia triticina TaxID=208348 RepID=A0ABY7CIZ3_9BASI|nr:uncharacterized protein PtA15_5A278 [Puccinia triticina]WAQ84705.1 hypothetical protein PtA15_5A278 [Puccinia triticina]WAR58050.1 hypothetical protein PtB15_5B282 [Puccinia triticina]
MAQPPSLTHIISLHPLGTSACFRRFSQNHKYSLKCPHSIHPLRNIHHPLTIHRLLNNINIAYKGPPQPASSHLVARFIGRTQPHTLLGLTNPTSSIPLHLVLSDPSHVPFEYAALHDMNMSFPSHSTHPLDPSVLYTVYPESQSSSCLPPVTPISPTPRPPPNPVPPLAVSTLSSTHGHHMRDIAWAPDDQSSFHFRQLD